MPLENEFKRETPDSPISDTDSDGRLNKAASFLWEKNFGRFWLSRPAYESAGAYISQVRNDLQNAGNILAPTEKKRVEDECFFAQSGFEMDMELALQIEDPKARDLAIKEAMTTFLDQVDSALGVLEKKKAKMTESKSVESNDPRKDERMKLFLDSIAATESRFAQAKVAADQKQAGKAQQAGSMESRIAQNQAGSMFAWVFPGMK